MASADQAIPITSRTISVNSHSMHYLEAGTGSPIVFLHGNPTSSYLWRNVIPHVAPHGHCIAVDLIGMGRSAKPCIDYRIWDHIAYVDAFLDALGLQDFTLVGHDWGVSIALHYLRRFPERVRSIAFMEGHLHPIESWDHLDDGAQSMFKRLRTADIGRKMVIEDNFFIEVVLPSGVHRTLSTTEMEAYREPFREQSDREPMWRWPQEIPIEGTPADVVQLVNEYQVALTQSAIPKLLLYARPGSVISTTEVTWCEDTLSNITTVEVGQGIHFLPEDQPEAIGLAIASWLNTH